MVRFAGVFGVAFVVSACALGFYRARPELAMVDSTATLTVRRVGLLSATTQGEWRSRWHLTANHLREWGIDVVKAPGRWPSEAAALGALCRDPSVQGLVVTDWNLLELWDCASRQPRLVVDGAYSGIPAMVDLLCSALGYPVPPGVRPSPTRLLHVTAAKGS